MSAEMEWMWSALNIEKQLKAEFALFIQCCTKEKDVSTGAHEKFW